MTKKQKHTPSQNISHAIYSLYIGRAIAQAFNRRLPNAAVRVPAQVRSCWVCAGQTGTGAGFLRVPRVSLPVLIPPTAPQSLSPITQGWYNRPVSGRRTKWTQSHPHPKNLKKKTKLLHYSIN
jgi:hypothetical protein